MLAAIISLSAAVLVLTVLLLLRIREEKYIIRQLKRIYKSDTNELIHSSGTCLALIRAVNIILKEQRRNAIIYRRKNHDLEQMMTNISHDLRTPLTSALGYLEIIQNSELPDDEKEREIGIVYLRMRRLDELINAFFEFSSVISGGHEPEREELNIIGVIEECMVHYYDDYSAQDRMIEFECDSRQLPVFSNRNMLMRIFDNLISNAFKHGNGTLYIRAEKKEGIVITFRNAIYDSALDVTRVFDEFYTTDISRTKGNTGLGLAIAKQFTELLGGRIEAVHINNEFIVKVTM